MARRFSKQLTRPGLPSLLIRCESCLYQIGRCALDLGITSKTIDPCHFWFATKPGHLPLGVVAVGLLSGIKSLLTTDFGAQELGRLLVTERSERLGGLSIFLQ